MSIIWGGQPKEPKRKKFHIQIEHHKGSTKTSHIGSIHSQMEALAAHRRKFPKAHSITAKEVG